MIDAARQHFIAQDETSIIARTQLRRKGGLVVDEIDGLLAEHYGLSKEELDFVINYDLKIRMGAAPDDEE